MTSNIFKNIKPKKTNIMIIKKKKTLGRKLEDKNQSWVLEQRSPRNYQKVCNRKRKNVKFHLTSIYYNTRHSWLKSSQSFRLYTILYVYIYICIYVHIYHTNAIPPPRISKEQSTYDSIMVANMVLQFEREWT